MWETLCSALIVLSMNTQEATGVNILSSLKENRWLPGTKLEETEVLDIWLNQWLTQITLQSKVSHKVRSP